jgi:SAM-dependent methyltransferase
VVAAGAARRNALLPRLGIRPAVAEIVRDELDSAIGTGAVVLDAGCGRRSALIPFRGRIGRFVGADIHLPAPGSLPHLDEFAVVDLCTDSSAFPAASFDVVLSSFTVEHFADPARAFANLRAWLRPGGRLVITTVNRRHPFVGLYLSVPGGLRSRLQRLVKATAADAHPLVGACNSPAELAAALEAAGFEGVRLRTVGHLARAWGRHWATWGLGLLGDLLAQALPSRRSTIVAVASAATPLAMPASGHAGGRSFGPGR